MLKLVIGAERLISANFCDLVIGNSHGLKAKNSRWLQEMVLTRLGRLRRNEITSVICFRNFMDRILRATAHDRELTRLLINNSNKQLAGWLEESSVDHSHFAVTLEGWDCLIEDQAPEVPRAQNALGREISNQ